MKRIRTSSAIALLVFAGGLFSVFHLRSLFDLFLPLQFLLFTALLLITHPRPVLPALVYLFITCLAGFAVEWLGIRFSVLVGSPYRYGNKLGWKWLEVPLVMGLNWFIVSYSTAMMLLALKRWTGKGPQQGQPGFWLMGAMLATLFDWILEPVAIRLGWWSWTGRASPPLFNYLLWVLVSSVLLILFGRLDMKRLNQFAVNLFLIQTIFFLLLSILL